MFRSRRSRLAITAFGVVAVIAVAMLVIRPWDRADEEPDAGITVETLGRRMNDALTAGGDVLLTRTLSIYESGEYVRENSTSTWVDIANQRARLRQDVEVRSPPLPQPPDRIIAGATGYYVDQDGSVRTYRSQSCPEPRALPLSEYMPCANTGDEITSRVVITEGPDASEVLAIKTTGKRRGIDSTVTFTHYLYVDPVTYLPIAIVERGADRMQDHTQRYTSTQHFTHDFVPRSTLLDDFFDPSSIGYVETAP
jgi:hypothetical protein